MNREMIESIEAERKSGLRSKIVGMTSRERILSYLALKPGAFAIEIQSALGLHYPPRMDLAYLRDAKKIRSEKALKNTIRWFIV